jgi:hypothetical protein
MEQLIQHHLAQASRVVVALADLAAVLLIILQRLAALAAATVEGAAAHTATIQQIKALVAQEPSELFGVRVFPSPQQG